MGHEPIFERYRQFLKTKAPEIEQQLVERRMAEEQQIRQMPMDRFVTHANIDRFVKLLKEDGVSPERRSMIVKLLMEEKTKLGNG
jgi:hypothetical protein